MRRDLSVFLWAGLLSSPAGQTFAQPSPARRAVLDHELPQLLEKYHVAGLGAALIKRGRVVWTGYYGLEGPGKPANATTLFNVASMAKPLSAEIIVRLASAGRLGLDDRMAPVWVDPDVAADPRHLKLTPRIALSHQTGFLNWRRMSKDGKLAFTFEPGTRFGYSGEGYMYVARYAERKTGRSFEALADELVFRPAGLREMSYSRRGWMNGRVATPMDTTGKWGTPDLSDEGRWDAADDLFTTVVDYARFVIGVMNGEGKSPTLAAEQIKAQVEVGNEWPCVVKPADLCPSHAGYALGWARFDYGPDPVVWHGGDDWGEHSMAVFYPETRDGAIVMVNGGSGRFAVTDALNLVDDQPPIPAFAVAHRSPVAVWLRTLLEAAYAGTLPQPK